MTLVEPHTSATAYQQQSRSWEPGTSDTDLVDRFRQGLGFASRYLAFTTAHACDVVSRGLQLQCELQAPAVCRQHLYVLYRRASDGCQVCMISISVPHLHTLSCICLRCFRSVLCPVSSLTILCNIARRMFQTACIIHPSECLTQSCMLPAMLSSCGLLHSPSAFPPHAPYLLSICD